uniref:PARP14 fifth type I KH domain-containing protein n=1 Tax=Anguilla anguilla TaxID=7936 RepID=A0A0E9QSV8_ANGAN
MEDVINLTPDQRKVTQEEHWRVFYSGLMQEVESSNNAQNAKISHADVQIAVCGFQNVVTDVVRKLRGYLNSKMPVTEVILLKFTETG